MNKYIAVAAMDYWIFAYGVDINLFACVFFDCCLLVTTKYIQAISSYFRNDLIIFHFSLLTPYRRV